MVVLLAHESAACDPGAPDGASTGIYTVRALPDERVVSLAAKSRVTLKVGGARLEAPRGPAQWVAGQVRNTAAGVARGVRVHAIFYDGEHKIVGFGDVVVGDLAPGASAPFRLASGALFAPAKSFAAIAYSLANPAGDAGARPAGERSR
jgi:hypothetical protein